MSSQRELQSYLARRVLENADDIAPELTVYVGGDSEEEIDASIARVKATSNQLVQHLTGWTQDVVREGTTTAPADVDLAARVNAMSAEEFGAYRAQLGIR